MKYILGMGNILRGDDGIGPRIIEFILKNNLENGFTCQDIGSNIWNLLPILSPKTEKILLIDAVKMGKNIGDAAIFSLQDVIVRRKQSSSETHDGELLSLLEMVKQADYHLPEIYIMGIQPQSFSYQIELSKTLQKNMDSYVQQAIEEIAP